MSVNILRMCMLSVTFVWKQFSKFLQSYSYRASVGAKSNFLKGIWEIAVGIEMIVGTSLLHKIIFSEL